MNANRCALVFLAAFAVATCAPDDATSPPEPDALLGIDPGIDLGLGGGTTTIPNAQPTNTHIVVFDTTNFVPLNFVATVLGLGGTVNRILEGAGLASVSGLTDIAADLLGALPGVESVTRDVRINWLPNDRAASLTSAPAGTPSPSAVPWWSQQWGLQRIQADGAWAAGVTGSGIEVGVIDTGIDYGHQELIGVVDLNRSRSYVNEAVPAGDHPVMDLHFHGTHVAGIVAAQAYRISGVAPHVRLVGLKVLSAGGQGTFEALIFALNDAGDMGLDLANLSLSALLPRNNAEVRALTKAVKRAIGFAESRGVVVVAAAGNAARSLDDQSVVATPCEQATLCVTATGPKLQQNFDQPAWYTNFGYPVINLAAPGGNFDPNSGAWQIEDLVIGPCSRRTTNPSLAGCRNTGVWYIYAAGTSQATPHATGVAALLDAKYGGSLVPGTVRDRLFRFSDDLGAAGKDDFYGFGRVNAAKAVQESPHAAPVASVTVSPSSATAPVGASGQLTATVKDADGNVLTGRTVTWASSNTSVVTVDQTGFARAVGAGSAAIVATCEGMSGQAQVTVTN
jgi:subtilisin family serine protease